MKSKKYKEHIEKLQDLLERWLVSTQYEYTTDKRLQLVKDTAAALQPSRK